MPGKWKKLLLLLLAAGLLACSAQLQALLNLDRDRLGLTRVEVLENAPPVLAFTTVALGGFRGLISNALWMRATDLQDEDKFFEMAQLADWITKLEPHFVQVWLVQAWNMAYNISVKFKDYPDRWRWVKRGFELLRDEGLKYNPNEILIYRELGWIFQHKIGQNLDDANMYYKSQWAEEMSKLFGGKNANIPELLKPVTVETRERTNVLVKVYKLDPEMMAQVDDRYGPLEWRLPEAHAVYWAALGLKKAQENPSKVKADDFITLRRVIYQSMQLGFQRGRLVSNPFGSGFEFGPNLDIIPKVSAAYEQAAEEDVSNYDHILRAHRNFLRDAVYFLYEHNRLKEAEYWFKYMGAKYPDKTLLDKKPKSFPSTLTLDQYAVGRIQEDVGETDRNRVKSAIEGYLVNSYTSLVVGEEDRYEGLKNIARKLHISYLSQIPKERLEAIGLPPFEEIDRDILFRLMDPEHGLRSEARAILRTRLGLPADFGVPKSTGPSTNTPPSAATPAPSPAK